MSRGNRTNTQGVAQAWRDGYPAQSGGSFMTDGQNLFSYRLLIGTTITDPETGRFKKVVFDYTASGEFKSTTTSKHVGYAKRVADETQNPPKNEITYRIVLD